MIDFDTIKELFKESIDESNTMNEALQRLFDKVYDKGKFDATDEQLLRQKIAQEVTDKMV